ncbi:Uncharacterized protein dnl_47020 [Desulfonema limicola]|uniref:Uncharacterized protein n=1 Tax=Desulfonema limicola TaxID=45656 RepID=A0A975BBE2_9BACT|nr:Uncharacterized protein dnl_47020 [Desulfonema limicola]
MVKLIDINSLEISKDSFIDKELKDYYSESAGFRLGKYLCINLLTFYVATVIKHLHRYLLN